METLYKVLSKLVVEKKSTGDLYYVGPISLANILVKSEYGPVKVEQHKNGNYIVQTDNEWGCGKTRSEAKRYFIGAFLS